MADMILSHWHQLIENLEASPQEFYKSVGDAVDKRKIPDAQKSRVAWQEGGILSAKREYLRISRGTHYFDVCGAPFGNGFFVSWWLAEQSGCSGCLLPIPILGPLLIWMFSRETYYKIDTALMFQDSVHSAVLEVIDAMTNAKGIRALTDTERRPTIRSLLMK